MNEWRNPRLTAGGASSFAEPGEFICLSKIPADFKPRLRFHLKLWHCASRVPSVTGYGYTPEMAYREWQEVVATKWDGERLRH
jgi:hypothetical protein